MTPVAVPGRADAQGGQARARRADAEMNTGQLVREVERLVDDPAKGRRSAPDRRRTDRAAEIVAEGTGARGAMNEMIRPFDIKDYLRLDLMPHSACPGCGASRPALLWATHELGIDKNNLAVVSGIGCSGRVGVYRRQHHHTTHGRPSLSRRD